MDCIGKLNFSCRTNRTIIAERGIIVASIYVKMKDGTTKSFPHKGRAGGSYTKSIRYEGGFAIIKDEWGCETAIPSADILEVEVEKERYW